MPPPISESLVFALECGLFTLSLIVVYPCFEMSTAYTCKEDFLLGKVSFYAVLFYLHLMWLCKIVY